MKATRVWVILGVVGLLAAPAAAATVMDSAPWSFPLSPGSQLVNVSQFNPALGTLNSVTVQLDAAIGANVTGENDSAIPGNVTLNLSGNASATAPNAFVIVLLNAAAGPVGLAATDAVPGSGPDYHDFGVVGQNGSNSNLASPMAPYIGVGTVGVTVNASGGFSLSGVSDSSLQISGFAANGLVKVIYDYTPVPEPTALMLLGIGGLALLRRRTA